MAEPTSRDMTEERELFAKAIREAWIRKFDRELAELAEPVIDVQTATKPAAGRPRELSRRG